MSLKSTILEDRKVASTLMRVQRIINDKFAPDAEQLRKEVFSTHASRDTRALQPGKILQSSAHNIIDASAEEVSDRSRLIEVKMQCVAEIEKLKEDLGALSRYIIVRYDTALKARHKSVTDRKAYVQAVLDKYYKRVRELEGLVTLIDLVVEDIDSASWALNRIANVVIAANNRRETK